MTHDPPDDPPNPIPQEGGIPTLDQAVEGQNLAIQSVPVKSLDTAAKEEKKVSDPQLTPLSMRQEITRTWLAVGLFAGFGALIGLIFTTILVDQVNWWQFYGPKPDKNHLELKEKQDQRSKDLINLVLASSTGFLGSALGFYFGSRESLKK